MILLINLSTPSISLQCLEQDLDFSSSSKSMKWHAMGGITAFRITMYFARIGLLPFYKSSGWERADPTLP